jgi:hypothetical protein
MTGTISLPKGKSDKDLVGEALMDKYGFKK